MFCKPKHLKPTKHLFVGNCGTALGLSTAPITAFFETFGACAVHAPDGASHTFASFRTAEAAEEAVRALSGRPVSELGDRVLTVKYSDVKEEKVFAPLPSSTCNAHLHAHALTAVDALLQVVEEQHVATKAEDCKIPGLLLLHDFVTEQEEQVWALRPHRC